MNRLPRVLARFPRVIRSSLAPRAALAASTLVLGLLAFGGGIFDDGLPSADGAGDSLQPAPASDTAAPAPNYSPFVLDLHTAAPGALPFHVVSFKDVGMSLPDDAARQHAYETLAEALSLEIAGLTTELGAPMTSSVRHDHHVTDPAAHLACEGGHLYVDVWRSGADGPYGYSLWSGCGEDDRFAYNESVGPDSGVASSAMDPLAEEIAESLEGALRRRCFQRAC